MLIAEESLPESSPGVPPVVFYLASVFLHGSQPPPPPPQSILPCICILGNGFSTSVIVLPLWKSYSFEPLLCDLTKNWTSSRTKERKINNVITWLNQRMIKKSNLISPQTVRISFIIVGPLRRTANFKDQFYNCVLSTLALKWKWGWSWPCSAFPM